MSTAVAIGLGIVAWVLSAILLAFFMGRMIQLRDRSRLDRTTAAAPPKPWTGGRSPPSSQMWELGNGTQVSRTDR